MKNWILVGGGGHACSCYEVIIRNGSTVKGYLDKKKSSLALPWNYLGNDEYDLNHFPVKDFHWHLAIGHMKDPSIRIQLRDKFKNFGIEFSSLISNRASLSSFSNIGSGCTILQNATVNSCANIGEMTILNTNCLLEHEVHVGEFCHISTGAILNGGVKIGDRVFIGSGAIVLQNIKIASDVIIGAGSVVIHDIHEKGIWVGNPARRIS